MTSNLALDLIEQEYELKKSIERLKSELRDCKAALADVSKKIALYEDWEKARDDI